MFKTWFVVGILRFVADILAFFRFIDFLGYFLKNWAMSFKTSGHPVGKLFQGNFSPGANPGLGCKYEISLKILPQASTCNSISDGDKKVL
jgi:hypothetical protein